LDNFEEAFQEFRKSRTLAEMTPTSEQERQFQQNLQGADVYKSFKFNSFFFIILFIYFIFIFGFFSVSNLPLVEIGNRLHFN